MHPVQVFASKYKRRRLRLRPESSLTFKVSTVLNDMRAVRHTICVIKGLVTVMDLQIIYREKRMGVA